MLKRLRDILNSKSAGNVVLLLLALLGAYLFLYCEVRFFQIPSTSMEPTLYTGDMIATMSETEYRRGDIAVFREPDSADYFVKRIVGVAGDEISVLRGALHINGEYASEPYILEPVQYEIESPVRIPENHVFVLGDNRNNSSDSHDELESFPVDAIVGRVRFIYYPYHRMGSVASYPLTNWLGQ